MLKTRTIPCYLVLACGLLLGHMISAAQLPQTSFPKLGNELVDIVEHNFYDAKRGASWSRSYRHYADQITDAQTFTQKTRAAIDALHSSHTNYYRSTDLAYAGLLSIFEPVLQPKGFWYDSIGIDVISRVDVISRMDVITRLNLIGNTGVIGKEDVTGKEEGYFVRAVFAGSPAQKAGLHRGDLLLRADNKPFAPITAFMNKSDQPVTLQVQRHPHTPPESITVVPRHIKPTEEWLQAQKEGTRLYSRNQRRIGYIPFFSGAGEIYQQAAQEAITGPLREADALILDFRNGFGGFNPNFVSLFDRNVPRLRMQDREGKNNIVDGHWRKPLYVLINAGSHSGKEVVAFALKKHHLATLIGENTGGAVLGGRPFLLSDGSLLYLAVTNGEVDGQRLEGKGVAPDIEVTDSLAFTQGTDRQLEKALSLAARKP